MRRTARAPGRLIGAMAILWALVLTVPLLVWTRHDRWTPPVFGVAVLSLVFALTLTLYTFATRATMDAEGVALSAFRARERLRAPLSDVSSYRMDRLGEWWVETAERCVHVAVREPWELHRAFLDFAPEKLRGQRKRFPGFPPTEDFVGLWTYDVEELASRAVGTVACFVLLLCIAREARWAALGQVLGLLIAPVLEAWGRLDVTREGLVRRGPFRRHALAWSDVRAIFREGPPHKRSFLVVGPERAIHIPAHLAIDRDVIEKVLYSLPDPILCVNFDETTLRGYRRRKKAREKASQEDLLPALTG